MFLNPAATLFSACARSPRSQALPLLKNHVTHSTSACELPSLRVMAQMNKFAGHVGIRAQCSTKSKLNLPYIQTDPRHTSCCLRPRQFRSGWPHRGFHPAEPEVFKSVDQEYGSHRYRLPVPLHERLISWEASDSAPPSYLSFNIFSTAERAHLEIIAIVGH